MRMLLLVLLAILALAATACQTPVAAPVSTTASQATPAPTSTALPATPAAPPSVVAGGGGTAVAATPGMSTSTPSPIPARPASPVPGTRVPVPTPVPGATSPKVVPPGAPTPSATPNDLPILVVETRAGQAVEVRSEIAATPPERARGLMFRQSLADGDGMLFIFPADTTSGFWMENTLVPLSIAWIDAQGVIVGLDDMQPLDRTIHNPPRSYRYALEVPQGFFARRGVQVGDRFFYRAGAELRPLSEVAAGRQVR